MAFFIFLNDINLLHILNHGDKCNYLPANVQCQLCHWNMAKCTLSVYFILDKRAWSHTKLSFLFRKVIFYCSHLFCFREFLCKQRIDDLLTQRFWEAHHSWQLQWDPGLSLEAFRLSYIPHQILNLTALYLSDTEISTRKASFSSTASLSFENRKKSVVPVNDKKKRKQIITIAKWADIVVCHKQSHKHMKSITNSIYLKNCCC